MVFFNCNNCGTVLKKNQVEKHMGCSLTFSCLDCQKEFRGNEFKAHTKCISEEAKYNGPDWKPKASQNKGERKQMAWVDTVNAALENGRSSMTPKQISLLIAVSKHDNVPRKRPKFLNFVKNVTRNSFDLGTIEAVWTTLEAEFKKNAPNPEANKSQTNGEAKDDTTKSSGITNGEGHVEREDNVESETKAKTKKKKRRKEAEEDEAETKLDEGDATITNGEGHSEENDLDGDSERKKKKKSKKRKKSEIEEEAVVEDDAPVANGDENGLEQDEGDSERKKKKKSKKRKSEIDADEMEQVQDSTTNGLTNDCAEENDTEESSERKKKKKSKKKKRDEEIEETEFERVGKKQKIAC